MLRATSSHDRPRRGGPASRHRADDLDPDGRSDRVGPRLHPDDVAVGALAEAGHRRRFRRRWRQLPRCAAWTDAGAPWHVRRRHRPRGRTHTERRRPTDSRRPVSAGADAARAVGGAQRRAGTRRRRARTSTSNSTASASIPRGSRPRGTKLAARHPMLRVEILPDGTQRIGDRELAVAVDDLRDLDADAAAGAARATSARPKSHQHAATARSCELAPVAAARRPHPAARRPGHAGRRRGELPQLHGRPRRASTAASNCPNSATPTASTGPR